MTAAFAPQIAHTREYDFAVPYDVSQTVPPIQFPHGSPDGYTSERRAGGDRSAREASKVSSNSTHKETLKIEMEVHFPKKEKKKKKTEVKKQMGSLLSAVFTEQKFPEPQYFRNVDCVGLPFFVTPKECAQIVAFAESQGFSTQHRGRVLNLQWCDIVDPFFARALWDICGLNWFLRTIMIDGMVPCGINDVVRIQKYVTGSLFGRHTDQHVRRDDGRISKYSLRVFLNGVEEGQFEGGASVFHVPFRQDPVVFEPEIGLGLLYPQGELCTLQEEQEVYFGFKYVLRADVLFCKPEDLDRFSCLPEA